MNDKEQAAFKLAFAFYDRWRDAGINTDEDWIRFAEDIRVTSEQMEDHRLGWHLLDAVIDTINDLYRNGGKPEPVSYFGRTDL